MDDDSGFDGDGLDGCRGIAAVIVIAAIGFGLWLILR